MSKRSSLHLALQLVFGILFAPLLVGFQLSFSLPVHPGLSEPPTPLDLTATSSPTLTPTTSATSQILTATHSRPRKTKTRQPVVKPVCQDCNAQENRSGQSLAAKPDCQACDVNGDGVVDILDVTKVGGTFGQSGAPGWIPQDIDKDGVVNVMDITQLGACIGQVVGGGTSKAIDLASSTSTDTTTLTLTDTLISTPTPTDTLTPTLTLTDAITTTLTPTDTPTLTPTSTPSPTSNDTVTSTPTSTSTFTPTVTNTLSPTPTDTITPSATSSITASSTSSPSPTPNVRMSVSLANSYVAGPGSTVNVDVLISSDAASRGAQTGFSFNPAVLNCSSVTEGVFFSNWANINGGSTMLFPQPSINNTTGQITTVGVSIIGAMGTPGPNGGVGGAKGSDVFLTLHCSAIANGVSPITLTNAAVVNDNPQFNSNYPLTVVDGQVLVGVTATPSPNSTPTDTPTSQAGTLSINPASPLIAPNQSFSVDLVLDINQPSWGAQFDGSFDKTILRCDSVTEGPFYKNWAAAHGYTDALLPAPACDNTNGIIKLGGSAILGVTTDGVGPSGSGPIFTLHFTTLAVGNSPITLSDVLVSDTYHVIGPNGHLTTSPLSISITGANVTVSNSAPTPTITATPTYTLTPTFTSTITYTSTPSYTKTITPTKTNTNTPTTKPGKHAGYSSPTLGPNQVRANASLSVNPAIKQLDTAGGTFTLDIQVSTDKPSRGGQTRVSFNPAVVQCVSISEGGFFKDWANQNGGSTILLPNPTCDNANGKTSLLGISVLGGPTANPTDHGSGPTGTGVFVTITFSAKSVGSSDITLDSTTSQVDTDFIQASQFVYTMTLHNGGVYIGVTPNPTQLAAVATATLGAGTTQSAALTTSPGPTGTGGTQTILGTANLSSGPTSTSDLGDAGNSAPISAGPAKEFNLLDKMDAQGVLTQDVQIESPDAAVDLVLAKGVQALTADNRRLQNMAIARIDKLAKIVGGFTTLDLGFQFGPEGATFDPPITLTIHYDPASLPKNVDEKNLTITAYDPTRKTWSALKSQVDLTNKTVSANISHFSVYALMMKNSLLGQNLLIAGIILMELLLVAGISLYIIKRRRAKAVVATKPAFAFQVQMQNQQSQFRPRRIQPGGLMQHRRRLIKRQQKRFQRSEGLKLPIQKGS